MVAANGDPVGNGRPRLVIKRLELENFKSYAGVQHVGPFHKSFSAIIGPNGSGKSNVIDAMLFVFGKKAKQLRLSKVSELIHNSAEHRDLQQARVSVFFEEIIDKEGGAVETVPGSALEVTRTATRDNKSQYFIAGKKSNFTGVTDLLKAKGVDLNNNRFLILQGEVEQIAMMKAKGEDKNEAGLLEYLEDIIGTDQYVAAIEEAAARLEGLSEARQAAVHRVKRAEGERDALEEARELALQYRAKDIAHVENSIRINLRNELACAANVEKTAEDLARIQEKVDYETEKLARVSEEHAALEKERDDADVAAAAAGKAAAAAEAALKKLEREQATVGEREKHLQKKVKAAEATIAAKEAKRHEHEAQAATAAEELPGAEAAAAEARDDLVAAEARLGELRAAAQGEIREVQERLSAARGELEPWAAKVRAAQAARTLDATQLQCLTQAAEAAAARLAEAQEQLRSVSVDAEHARDEIAAMEAEVAEQAARGERAAAAAAAAAAKAEAAERAAGEARGAAGGIRAALDGERSRGRVLQALMAAQAEGTLSGIHGRLGDLGAIDAQYDAAVSNAASALDYIVVGTVADGQAAVQFLRERNLGVASCLILEKQRHFERDMATGGAQPEGCPRLFDLIKCDDAAHRTAFFFAVRNTLVCADMAQARRLAYQGRQSRRVVTLAGQLIAENGTMTGGGNSVRTGKMRIGGAAPAPAVDAAQAAADLAAAERRVAEAEAELRAARDAQRANTEEAAAARVEAGRAEAALRRRRAEAESAAKQHDALQRQVADAERAAEASERDAGKIAALQEALTAHDARLAAAKADAAGAEAAVAAVQRELDGVGGAPMQQQRDLVDTLKSDIEGADKQVATQRALASKAGKAAAALAAELVKRGREREQLAAELAGLAAGVEAGAAEAADRRAEHAARAAEATAALEQFNSLYEQHNSKGCDVRTIRETVRNLEAKHAERLALHEAEDKKAANCAAKAAELKLHLSALLPEGEEREEITSEAVAALDADAMTAIQLQQSQLDGEMAELKAVVDMGALERYAAADAEYRAKAAALAAATAERDAVRDAHDGLRAKRLDEFMAGFLAISLKLKEMYQMITLGGDAELELVDTMDPFSEGIVFSVRPPKKSWKNIVNLSGGEKTLSSLALVFALHHYKPTPLYFMDEIDAALDFKNVSIVANYVKEQTQNAQFVVISLRNNMFELADHLVGIYKTANCTKSVAINPNEYVVGQARPLLQQQRA